MELGKQIRKHRQEAHISQEELANRIYVSRQTSGSVIYVAWYLGVNSVGGLFLRQPCILQ